MKKLPKLDGLGDAVELVTKVTGIKAVTEVVSKATGRDCGCAKRKDKLNKLVPFNRAQTDDPSADVQSD
jgi:hypothetical protein